MLKKPQFWVAFGLFVLDFLTPFFPMGSAFLLAVVMIPRLRQWLMAQLMEIT